MREFWHSDRLIIICFAAGNRGRALDRIISFSPEINKPLTDTNVMPSGSAHATDGWLIAPDGSHWNPNVTVSRAWNDWQSWTDQQLREIRRDTALHINLWSLMQHFSSGGRMSMITHAHVSVTRRLWPTASYVKPLWRDGGRRQFRDFANKMLYYRPRNAVEKAAHHVIDHELLDQSDCQLDAICRQRFGTTQVTDVERKQVLRDYWGMETQSINRDFGQQGIIEVDLNELFDPQHWPSAYHALMERLNITANPDAVQRFMRDYLPLQWQRSTA